MRKPCILALPVVLGLSLTACSWIEPPPAHLTATPVQAGPFEGQVREIHADSNSVMTERKSSEGTVDTLIEVKPAADLAKIQVGDHIAGRIVVEPHGPYATDVRIIK